MLARVVRVPVFELVENQAAFSPDPVPDWHRLANSNISQKVQLFFCTPSSLTLYSYYYQKALSYTLLYIIALATTEFLTTFGRSGFQVHFPTFTQSLYAAAKRTANEFPSGLPAHIGVLSPHHKGLIAGPTIPSESTQRAITTRPASAKSRYFVPKVVESRTYTR